METHFLTHMIVLENGIKVFPFKHLRTQSEGEKKQQSEKKHCIAEENSRDVMI